MNTLLIRHHFVPAAIVAIVVCSLFSGCQTFAPFSQAMRTRVAVARQWTKNGIGAIRRGAVREARECFSKASSQMPDDHRILANVARAHFQEGEIEKAIEVMTRAVEYSENDVELAVELAEMYLEHGQLETAEKRVDECLQENSRVASAWLLKGKLYAARGEFKTALGAFQRSLGIDNAREDVQLEIVKTYQQMGNPLRALSAVEQLLEKYPLDRQPESAVLAKSRLLVQLDQTSSAIEVLKRAAQREDVSELVYLDLARVQLECSLPERAAETIEEANRLFPNSKSVQSVANVLENGQSLLR